MNTPCKIVTFTKEERDNFRKLRDSSEAATKAFTNFKNSFKRRNAPASRYDNFVMEILDEPAVDGGTTHAYFLKILE